MFGKKSNGRGLSQIGRSYIAETMQVEGDMHSTGAVDVAGLIKGNVHVSEVMVLDTGSIKGNLHVTKIEINGHVEGEVTADLISLGKNAVIKGDLLFKVSLRTEEGADIEGYIKRISPKEKTTSGEEKDIQDIMPRPELGKPELVRRALTKDNEKEAV